MKTIVFHGEGRTKRGMLHVEAPGCLVNIEVGLSDKDGNEVTAVEIIANRYADDTWHLPDRETEKQPVISATRVRVVHVPKEKTKEQVDEQARNAD